MMDVNEFTGIILDAGDSKITKMATVVDLFSNGNAKLKFDGEEAPSEKEYGSLGGYLPSTGDRVVLLGASGTWVILGKIRFKESAGSDGGATEVDKLIVDKSITIPNTPSSSYSIKTKGQIWSESTIIADNRITANLGFRHVNGSLGFYGKASNQQPVNNLLNSADLTATVNKVNEVLNGLKALGLFR